MKTAGGNFAVEVKHAFGIEPFCALQKVTTIARGAACYASFMHLVLISIDRCIATKNALRYREIATKQRIKNGVLVAWAITVALTIQEIVLAVIDSETKNYSVFWSLTVVITSIICLTYIAGICYCYVYIFSETRRQKTRLQTEQLSQEEAK